MISSSFYFSNVQTIRAKIAKKNLVAWLVSYVEMYFCKNNISI